MTGAPKHLAWITDIPTPYRNHQFERMVEIFPRHDLEFRIHYMSWTERRRPWNFRPDELHFPYTLHPNPVPALARRSFHVNPGLAAVVRRADAVVIGGWGTPSHALTPFLTPRRTPVMLAVESHPGSVTRVHAVARLVKRAIIHRYDGFVVAGERSRDLITSLDPASASKPYVVLPNVIDARLFRDRVAVLRRDREALRQKLGVAPGVTLWFCPSRLSPEKGVLELLPMLAGLTGIELLIAGDGPQREEAAAIVARDRLPVRLLGQQDETHMLELYAAADLFVLPSQRDASPLTAVEASAAGLPLFLSNHAGNCDDLVIEGENGWRFDVEADEAGRRAQVRDVAAVSRDRLAAMGPRSSAVYAERFDSDVCVDRLAAFIKTMVARAH